LARRILDDAGWREAKIMASGDLNEDRIAELVAAGAPIDSFGVGTELATSRDAPAMGSIYKLVETAGKHGQRATAKFSPAKPSLPGAKQVFRFPDRDVLALADEQVPGAMPLLEPVIQAGRRASDAPDLARVRDAAARKLAAIPERYRRPHQAEAYP